MLKRILVGFLAGVIFMFLVVAAIAAILFTVAWRQDHLPSWAIGVVIMCALSGIGGAISAVKDPFFPRCFWSK